MKLNPIKRKGAQNMYLRPDAKKPVIWWDEYRESLSPKRQTKSTGLTYPEQFETARKWIEDQRIEWRGLVRKVETWMFDDAALKYLESSSAKDSPKTHLNKKIDIEKHLIPEFGVLLPREMTNEVWLRYVKRSRPLNGEQKFFNRRKTLISILNFLHDLASEDKNYLSKVPKFDEVDPETSIGKYLEDDKIEALLKNQPLECQLQIQIGHKMGCRHGEVLRISLSDIDFKEGFIHLKAAHVKTRKSRDIRISKHVLPLLKKQIALSMDLGSDWLFASSKFKGKHMSDSKAQDLWDEACTSAGVKARFHDLRHTCATNMAESNVPPFIACSQLGMSYRTYEKVYLKRRKSALKAAYEAWEGL